MYCPFCGDSGSRVVDSRLADQAVRRRRECPACSRRFTTYERYDEGPLYIRKRGGQRQPFDRDKLMAGLERAAIKRPIERDQLEAIVDRIVAELRSRGGTPDVQQVGELAMLQLRTLDPVAYVRFASVYKKFADVAEFESELERIEREAPVQNLALFGAKIAEQGSRRDGVDGNAGFPASVRTKSQAAELPPEAGFGAPKRRQKVSATGNREKQVESNEGSNKERQED